MEPVANITGNEFAPTGKNDLVQRVVDYWEQFGNTAHNPMLGEVKLDKSSARASIAHGIGRIKAAAFSAVKEVIENGVFIEHAPNWKGRGDDSYVFAAPISINGEDYICEVILMKNKARTGFYLHEVQVKEKLLDVFKTGVVTSTLGAPKSILLQVMGRVKDIERKCSKILDENGEPLVVYHGTRRGGFRVFRTEGRGKTSDTGAFFSSSRDNAEGYAMNEDGEVPKDMLYEVFLNIREPETVDFKGNNWNRVPDRPVGYIVKFKSGDTEWYDNREEAESAADMYESDPGTVEEDWGDEDNSYTLDDLAREVREEGYSDGLIAENIIRPCRHRTPSEQGTGD